MTRKITIELTKNQAAMMAGVYRPDLDPMTVAQGATGWPDESAFWSEIITLGLDAMRALQEPIEGDAAAPDGGDLPF